MKHAPCIPQKYMYMYSPIRQICTSSKHVVIHLIPKLGSTQLVVFQL